MARELVLLAKFKRDLRRIRRHPEYDKETLEHVLDLLTAGHALPREFCEHPLKKLKANWAGYVECHLGADLLLIYRVRKDSVTMHRIGTHKALFKARNR